MRSATPDPIPSIRQALGIDTWGMDLFRMKRRMGELIQRLAQLETEVAILKGNRTGPQDPVVSARLAEIDRHVEPLPLPAE